MNKAYFLKTDRIGFSKWCDEDLPLAKLLWGDSKVTRYICASGSFSQSDIENRLQRELENEKLFGIQYWPVFERTSGELIGCCGLRPRGVKQYEIGFHLRSQFWDRVSLWKLQGPSLHMLLMCCRQRASSPDTIPTMSTLQKC